MVDRRISLYHLFWGNRIGEDWSKPVLPSVPEHTMDRENKTIKRICTAPSLDDCLTALGPNLIGLYACTTMMQQHEHQVSLSNILSEVTFPFTVARFEVDRKDPNVFLPGTIIDYVPDAFLTQECWLTKPTVPDTVEQLWLVNGKISEEFVLCGGLKCRYLTITDSEWSKEDQKPDHIFLKNIMKATREWLEQDMEMEEERGSEKGSLDEKIQSATRACEGLKKSSEREQKKEFVEFGK